MYGVPKPKTPRIRFPVITDTHTHVSTSDDSPTCDDSPTSGDSHTHVLLPRFLYVCFPSGGDSRTLVSHPTMTNEGDNDFSSNDFSDDASDDDVEGTNALPTYMSSMPGLILKNLV
ncbi:hypothetical protein L6452_03417 [Arctium lappa]|uniref:Uncharacterized protein n=1 Tax=Arctium lappa TaxID=4217 RepID=A0ACB9FMN7_ARCLA|nr:hypothetical protein L6452_03417 [Arctium lappa]